MKLSPSDTTVDRREPCGTRGSAKRNKPSRRGRRAINIFDAHFLRVLLIHLNINTVCRQHPNPEYDQIDRRYLGKNN